MIIVGYPCIGKSTLARSNHRYIDLESSSFWVDGQNGPERDANWHRVYINIAEHLSGYGYDVFVSSHEPVYRELLMREKNNFMAVVPAPTAMMMSTWLERLYHRYEETRSDKDYKAYTFAKENYMESTEALIRAMKGHSTIVLDKPVYDLDVRIKQLNMKRFAMNTSPA